MHTAWLFLLVVSVPATVGQVFSLSSRSWRVGETVAVDWTNGTASDTLDLEVVSVDTGITTRIGTGVLASARTLPWMVPADFIVGRYFVVIIPSSGMPIESNQFWIHPAVPTLLDSVGLDDVSLSGENRQFLFNVWGNGELSVTLTTMGESTVHVSAPGSGPAAAGNAITSATATGGTHQFNLTTAQTGEFRLGVESTGEMAYTVTVTLVSYDLQLTYPVAVGKKVRPGPSTITWHHGNVGSTVLLELYRDGALQTVLGSSIPNTGTYFWNANALTPGTGYSIHLTFQGSTVECCGGAIISDVSETFEVYARNIEVTSATPEVDAVAFNEYAIYYFALAVPSKVTITVTPDDPAANVDVFVGINFAETASRPTSLNNDVSSQLPTGVETIVFDIAAASPALHFYYVAMKGVSQSQQAGFSLVVDVNPALVPDHGVLLKNVFAVGEGASSNQWRYFVYDSTDLFGFVYLSVVATSASPVLYVAKNVLPTETEYLASSSNMTGSSEVEMPATRGRHIVGVLCVDSGCSFDVVATYSSRRNELGSPGYVIFPQPFSEVFIGADMPIQWEPFSEDLRATVTIEFVGSDNTTTTIIEDVPDGGLHSWPIPTDFPTSPSCRVRLVPGDGSEPRYSSVFALVAAEGTVEDCEDCGGMSAGMIAGIVLSSVAFVFIVFSLIYFFKVRDKEDQKDEVARRQSMRMSRIAEYDQATRMADGDELVNVPGFTSLADAQGAKRQSMIPDEFVRQARQTGVQVDRKVAGNAPPPPQRTTSVTFATFDVGDVVDAQGAGAAPKAEKPAWATQAGGTNW